MIQTLIVWTPYPPEGYGVYDNQDELTEEEQIKLNEKENE